LNFGREQQWSSITKPKMGGRSVINGRQLEHVNRASIPSMCIACVCAGDETPEIYLERNIELASYPERVLYLARSSLSPSC
jgi:hypothetical protein